MDSVAFRHPRALRSSLTLLSGTTEATASASPRLQQQQLDLEAADPLVTYHHIPPTHPLHSQHPQLWLNWTSGPTTTTPRMLWITAAKPRRGAAGKPLSP
jgi:hypothetical protein